MIGLYARASIDWPSAEDQLDELQQLVDDLDLGEAAAVIEASTTSGRPALERLVCEARAGQFDAIAVTRLDRLAGSIRQLGELLEELGEVRLIAVVEQLDTHTRRGRIVAQGLIRLAAFEREAASETTRTALAHARARGVRLGRPPRPAKESPCPASPVSPRISVTPTPR